jgi:hypothetical protein
MAQEQYFEYCTPPKAAAQKYWTKRFHYPTMSWRRKYNHGAYNRDSDDYNKCLRQSKYGRAKAEFDVGCKINNGKVDCGISTGHTNPATVPGNVGQLGLSQDKGTALDQLAKMDKRILIGAAVALLLLAR